MINNELKGSNRIFSACRYPVYLRWIRTARNKDL